MLMIKLKEVNSLLLSEIWLEIFPHPVVKI